MSTTPTPVATPAESRTLSILSLVAAIAAIPLGHVLLLPIAAIVLGFIARQRELTGHSMSTAGIVIGFVVLFGWVAVGLIALTIVLPLGLLHHAF
ncbi:MAG TPA: DUF4190 domain-containing protein [Galbitalea sp.]|jgi:4-hydroxybenzoate polyprenyltransferase